MCGVRLYLPATLPGLSARLPRDSAGTVTDIRCTVTDAGAVAYAVTPALREWYREGDLEELEYAALNRAARASLRLLAAVHAEQGARGGPGGPGGPGADRRLVVAADVPDAGLALVPDVDVAAVRLATPVRFEMVAAVHVDDPAVADEVSAALRMLEAAEAATTEAAVAADAAHDDAQFALDSLDDHELQWFAAQEIGFLLG
jgi:hypothetical protein